MLKFVNYLGLGMAVGYICFGLYLLIGQYFIEKPMSFPNQHIFGGLLVGYGSFRIYRFIANSRL